MDLDRTVAVVASRLSPPSRRWLRALGFACAFFCFATFVGLAKVEMRVLGAELPPADPAFLLPSPRAARILSAKYHEAAADAAWTKLLVYYGERASVRETPLFMAAYADAILALDPMFRAPYAWAGFAMPLATAGWIDPRNVEDSIRILRAGVARFPDDPELHGMLGYNLFYELPRWIADRDRIVRARIEGAEHLRAEAALGGGAGWLALSATVALRDAHLDDVAARHLEESAYATEDPELRRRILWRLAQLRASTDIQVIQRAVDTLEGVRAERAPYLSQGLFLLASPPEALERMAEGLRPPPLPEDGTNNE